ncbi:MAG: hypothetical protein AABM43_07890 [Actinomycetota bacterium]
MSDWTLQIPHRSRSDSITAAMSAAHALPPEERAVARNVLTELATEHGCRSAADALDMIEGASPEARRELLDRARVEAGLPTTEVADSQAEYEARQKTIAAPTGPMRGPNGYLEAPICAAKDCMTAPQKRTKARRWWCPAHRAGHEEDLEPYTGPKLAYGPGGTVIDLDEQEADRQRAMAAAASQKAQRKERETEQRAAAEQHAEDRRARDEQVERELPDPMFPR